VALLYFRLFHIAFTIKKNSILFQNTSTATCSIPDAMKPHVYKFGGSSLANPERIREAIQMVRCDPKCLSVVVSAFGARFKGDLKATDLLLRYVAKIEQPRQQAKILTQVKARFAEIAAGFEETASFDTNRYWDHMAKIFAANKHADFFITRGEHCMARLMALILGFRFVDATEFIRLERGCYLLEQSKRQAKKIRLAETPSVVPGFYGLTLGGFVQAFQRGGSDISGAMGAELLEAETYFNCTDVNGVLDANPDLVPNAQTIPIMSFDELGEMASRGASVVHSYALRPVRRARIPVIVRNTRNPEHQGTLITRREDIPTRIPGSILGLAGRNGFLPIIISKDGMDEEVAFLATVTRIFADHGLNIEHIPDSRNAITVIVNGKAFRRVEKAIRNDLAKKCHPDSISIGNELALVCVVGAAMREHSGVAAQILNTLASERISVSTISQGGSEISIVLGISNDKYEAAMRALHAGLL